MGLNRLCQFIHNNLNVQENETKKYETDEVEFNNSNIQDEINLSKEENYSKNTNLNDDIKAAEESVDEESFQTYVKSYYPALFQKFKTDKTCAPEVKNFEILKMK